MVEEDNGKMNPLNWWHEKSPYSIVWSNHIQSWIIPRLHHVRNTLKYNHVWRWIWAYEETIGYIWYQNMGKILWIVQYTRWESYGWFEHFWSVVVKSFGVNLMNYITVLQMSYSLFSKTMMERDNGNTILKLLEEKWVL